MSNMKFHVFISFFSFIHSFTSIVIIDSTDWCQFLRVQWLVDSFLPSKLFGDDTMLMMTVLTFVTKFCYTVFIYPIKLFAKQQKFLWIIIFCFISSNHSLLRHFSRYHSRTTSLKVILHHRLLLCDVKDLLLTVEKDILLFLVENFNFYE